MKKGIQKTQIAIYHVLGDEQKIRVRIEDENVWLTQKLIAELFNVSIPTVNEHLKNIFESGELSERSVIRNFRITAKDGKGYATKHYNLDTILAVGYRVRSDRGTQFRTWATQRLREYLIKGFTMDDERLKQGGGRARYFEELLQRIRDILKCYPNSDYVIPDRDRGSRQKTNKSTFFFWFSGFPPSRE